MADNVTITEGTGTTVATDQIGTVHYQEIKLIDGTKDSTTPIVVDVGAKANALRVAPANNITDATYIGDIKFGEAEPNSAAIKTAVELLDNAVDGNYLNCNLNIAGTDVSANAGVLTAQTLRVTIATDDECNNLLGTIDADTGAIKTATELIDDAVYADDADWTDGSSKHILVGGLYQSTPQTVTDGDVAPLEVDVNGKIIESNSAAIKTALEIMDDWDDANYCNVNLNVAGTDVAANAGTLNAQTIRVTIATDDECNNFLGTIDADTGAIKTAVELLDNAVDGNYLNVNMNLAGSDAQAGEGTISATTQRVTIATDDDGVAHLATIAGDTTNIETAIQIIDDWDAVHDSAASSDGPQLMAAYDSTKPTAVADGDAVRVLADASGRLLAGVEPERFQATITSADATSATSVKAKTASKQIHVLSLIISTDTAMNIQLQDDAGTPVVLMEQIYLAANGGMALTFPPEAPLVVATNQDLDVIASAAGNISVTITGYLMS